MKYPFNRTYQPPFPAVEIVLHNSEDGLHTTVQDALLDTGADGTLVPITFLQDILAPALSDTRIRSHWGEWRSVQLFLVDIQLDNLKLPNIFVIGDEQGDEIILGRDVLNKLRLLLDGPANLTNLPPQ
jgi:predicted aspartyl protease